MALDAATITAIREWVGSSPDDDALETAFDIAGTINGTALSILRTRRADLLTSRSWGLPGDYYEGATSLANLDSAISQLEALIGGVGPSALTAGTITRGRVDR